MEKSDSEKEPLKKFKTFCVLPWMHFSLNPNGRARLCCNATHPERDIIDEQGQPVFIDKIKNTHNFFNLPFYKEIRKQMFENQKPKACSNCYAVEEYGGISLRRMVNAYWRHSISKFLNFTEKDGTVKKVDVKYMDLPLGNLCNLRCRMCHPNHSIQLVKDFDYLKMSYDHENINSHGNWTKDPKLYLKLVPILQTVEEIFFTGGEPLLIKEHENILKKAIELKVAQNIKIKYNSNLTKLNKRLFNLWKEFRRVEFNCSIDGFGKVNDYIRFPSKWFVIEQSLDTLDNISEMYPHIKIYINSTFQVLNLFGIPDLLKWAVRAKWRNIHRVPHFIWLHSPKYFRSTVLPDKLKQKAVDAIEQTLEETTPFFMNYKENHKDWSKMQLKVLSGCLKRLKRTPQEKYLEDFIHYNSKMDSFRKQNITQIIPEFEEIM